MNGLNDAYVESVIKKARVGRPKWIPGPNHPWKKFVINPKKD